MTKDQITVYQERGISAFDLQVFHAGKLVGVQVEFPAEDFRSADFTERYLLPAFSKIKSRIEGAAA